MTEEQNNTEEIKSLKNKVSPKTITLDALKSLIDIFNGNEETLPSELEESFLDEEGEAINNFKAILLTPVAQIEGDIVNINPKFTVESENNNKLSIDLSGVLQLRNSRIKALEEQNGDLKFMDSGAFISVKNAKLSPLSNPDVTHNYPQLILFADQIIGFTINNKRN
ncbi:MAG: hypothetical protein AWU54_2252 [Candidatus Frackibacter sp. T328-2]|nr:MAG: hypothetical protein AWU54_2252 [Candidatus Frackibacter sp. T328-2]